MRECVLATGVKAVGLYFCSPFCLQVASLQGILSKRRDSKTQLRSSVALYPSGHSPRPRRAQSPFCVHWESVGAFDFTLYFFLFVPMPVLTDFKVLCLGHNPKRHITTSCMCVCVGCRDCLELRCLGASGWGWLCPGDFHLQVTVSLLPLSKSWMNFKTQCPGRVWTKEHTSSGSAQGGDVRSGEVCLLSEAWPCLGQARPWPGRALVYICKHFLWVSPWEPCKTLKWKY